MRRFVLNRKSDISGISGTGYVAEGVMFSNGRCVISWLTEHSSITVFDCLEDLILIHGHDGATEVIWVDGELNSDG